MGFGNCTFQETCGEKGLGATIFDAGAEAVKRTSVVWRSGERSLPLFICFYLPTDISQLNLDGTVDVVHPDYTKETYPIERLTRLYDGVEQYEDGMLDDEGSDGMHEDAEEDLTWTMGEDGRWQVEMEEDREDWEDVDESGAEADMTVDEEQSDIMDEEETAESETLAISGDPSKEEVSEDHQIAEDDEHWKRFDSLPTAPVDHAFYTSPAGQRPKAFLTRLNREYKALSSSLPG